jgi:signal transduction histidine kinase
MGTSAVTRNIDYPEWMLGTDAVDNAMTWAAHELRGPLHAARAALDHIVELSVQGEVEPALVRRTRDQLDHVLRFIDPLMRCASGVAWLDVDAVDLARLAREVAEAEVSATQGAHGRIRFAALDTTRVVGNAPLLKVALGNLVRNALHHSDRDEPVSVAVRTQKRTAVVSVRDRGTGIPLKERELIFQPGLRGADAARSGRAGLGLGLFIARRIANDHGGHVRLAASALGSDFRLELPLTPLRSR